MLSRKVHRYIGLAMLIPMIGWTFTGLIFFIKPGYDGAYEILKPRTYPLEPFFSIESGEDWEEIRLIKSVIGNHLLVKSQDEFMHFLPNSMEIAPIPESFRLKKLFGDAISHNVGRYGEIDKIVGTTAYTTTGITIELDWNKLEFTQKGFDRKIINLLYKVHYLQWTPWSTLNQILGIVGLIMLITLSAFGLRIYIVGRR